MCSYLMLKYVNSMFLLMNEVGWVIRMFVMIDEVIYCGFRLIFGWCWKFVLFVLFVKYINVKFLDL